MNAVEIEEAVSALAERPFDAAEFPFAFLEAFGNKATTIKRLRAGASNRSDLAEGVLQTNHIHISVAEPGAVTETLGRLKASPATAKAKAKFVLATDGDTFEAEDVESGETERFDPARNMARFYVLSIEPTLFGDEALVRRWGRIGSYGRHRSEFFREPAAAQVALEAWRIRKRRRGYVAMSQAEGGERDRHARVAATEVQTGPGRSRR